MPPELGQNDKMRMKMQPGITQKELPTLKYGGIGGSNAP